MVDERGGGVPPTPQYRCYRVGSLWSSKRMALSAIPEHSKIPKCLNDGRLLIWRARTLSAFPSSVVCPANRQTTGFLAVRYPTRFWCKPVTFLHPPLNFPVGSHAISPLYVYRVIRAYHPEAPTFIPVHVGTVSRNLVCSSQIAHGRYTNDRC